MKKIHLPPNVPAKDFWSLTIYDPQTRSMLQTDQRLPRTSNQEKDLIIFGPVAPSVKEANWIQTIPGKGWFVMLRLYGPSNHGSIRPGGRGRSNLSLEEFQSKQQPVNRQLILSDDRDAQCGIGFLDMDKA
jgi:hypothetical protein